MEKKKSLEERQLAFETLQLQVRSRQIRLPMQEQCRFMQLHLMYSTTVIMQRQDLIFLMPEISMED